MPPRAQRAPTSPALPMLPLILARPAPEPKAKEGPLGRSSTTQTRIGRSRHPAKRHLRATTYWQSATGIVLQGVTGAPETSVYVGALHVPPHSAPVEMVVFPCICPMVENVFLDA